MSGSQGGRFELQKHTADVAVEATGNSLEAVFAAVADGLAAASCEEIPDTGDRFSLSVAAESREALLFDYLDELIYLRDVRAELPVDHRVEAIDGPTDDGDGDSGDDGTWSLEASARGVPLAEIDAREVKAVTYSEMRLERVEGEGWESYVVFDV
ncbi:archease [Natronolimnohabitans sp. A-GB9]|uniref:archease n=1 Tax=Natronolimnohabitans sp. A-GB9 TaxID=3069757 RepID=UPI0027B2E035|nr:archease [Natronolimnohabitans sp. A-GB9]MDQ2049533.1 archease [Natronolimnohabitans sp. A-GB9]